MPAKNSKPKSNTAESIALLLPQMGNSMEEGTIAKWRVSEGDTISVGQIIYDLETDKAVVEVEADVAGTIAKIVAQEGVITPIKEVVAYIGSAPADVAAAPAATSTAAPAVATPLAATDEGITALLLPQMGNSMEEGTIVKWRVSEGDTISIGQIIYDLETDKAVVEVEADVDGRLAKIVAQEGEITAIKTPVAFIGDDDSAVEAYIAAAAQTPATTAAAQTTTSASPKPAAQNTSQTAAQTTTSGRVKASPNAKKIASQRGINIATLPAGSGPGGRILSSDIPMNQPAATAPASTTALRTTMSSMRKGIGKALLMSKQTIPHFYIRLTVQADAMFDFYRSRKTSYPCSLNDVITMACAKCLMELPAVRSRIDGDDLVVTPSANIGIAVGTDDGLTVPVLIEAENMNLQTIAAESKRIVLAARDGKLEGLGQGCFTISNLGMFGVQEFAAIVNPPEAAILAVGAAREDVVVENGAIKAARVMTMTLSADHRIVDGLVAGQFCTRLKEILETPEEHLQ